MESICFECGEENDDLFFCSICIQKEYVEKGDRMKTERADLLQVYETDPMIVGELISSPLFTSL